MAEVAQRAKVSVGTVSNVVGGFRGVSPKRRERVLKAIEELGYTRNLLAHGLRSHSPFLLGLCVPRTRLGFFSVLVDVFQELASRNGYQVIQVLSPSNSAGELESIRNLMTYKIGGLILVPSVEPARTLEYIEKAGVPTVIVDRPTENRPGFDQVCVDNRKAMAEIAARLIGLGHRSIMFIVKSRDVIVSKERIQGLREAIETSGQPVTAEVMEIGEYEDFSESGFLDEYRKCAPTAIIPSNDIIATLTIRALRSLRIGCPEDVSLVVFDAPEWSDIVTPPLSIVRLPAREMASDAWQLLVKRMSGQAQSPRKVVLEAEIEFRESVRPARHPDRIAVLARQGRAQDKKVRKGAA